MVDDSTIKIYQISVDCVVCEIVNKKKTSALVQYVYESS